MKRKKSRRLLKIILFCLGIGICSYPIISNVVSQIYLNNTIATYQKQVESCDDSNLKEMLENAREYNRILFQSKENVLDPSQANILNPESYYRILDLFGNGIMGSIEIPKIGVNLPIYHGTSDEVLAVAVGHIEGTSLPIGGKNTRTVLSGHRGLPNSKLFTRLDELIIGDFFFIRVLNQTLAYEVLDIEVINPDDVDKLELIPDQDLVTLLTCTPYGLNTHRLIVTGARVPYIEKEYKAIEEEMMSHRELLFMSIPFVFIIWGIRNAVNKKIRKKRGKK